MAEKVGFPEILSFGPTGYGDDLAWGLLTSISIAVLAYGIGLLIGIIGAVGKLTGSTLTRTVLNGYTTLVRAVPDLILILILFYAGTSALNQILHSFGLPPFAINGFLAAVCVLGFVQGSYSRISRTAAGSDGPRVEHFLVTDIAKRTSKSFLARLDYFWTA